MLVCTTPMIFNVAATIVYRNEAGVQRTTTAGIMSSLVTGGIVSASNSSAAAGSVSPFIPLAGGDKEASQIDSITLSAGAGGFFAAVIVKPLQQVSIREANTVSEIVSYTHRANLPEIKEGAYLNFPYLTGTNGTFVTLRGHLKFSWG